MNVKTVTLNQSVYALCTQYPELAGIMAEIGFRDITKPGMLATAGHFMTIPKGAVMKGLDIALIKARLIEYGFTIVE